MNAANPVTAFLRRQSMLDALLRGPSRLSRWLDRHAAEFAPLPLRLLLAYEYLESGLEKWRGDNWFDPQAFPLPFSLLSADANWNMAMGLELLAPVLLVLGLGVRVVCLALMVLTVVAIQTAHWPMHWQTLAELWQGYAISDHGHGNFKLPLMYLLMLSALLLHGAGGFSLDAGIGRRSNPL